jgi:stage II sporulation protein R
MKKIINSGGIFMTQFIKLLIEKNRLFIYSKTHTMIIASIITGVIITALISNYSNHVNKDISNSLLRLHVIANSNLKEDQALKLEVRDAVISQVSEKFKSSKDINETKKMAVENLDLIEKAAREVISKNGKQYSVKVSMTDGYFPTKYYGDVVLPSGNYNAVKVEIGESKGENWWCVLFPPLCFVDATNGQLPESSKEKLKNSLTEEEYKLISSSSIDGNVPVKIKFKTVEIWQQSKHKVQVAIENLNR